LGKELPFLPINPERPLKAAAMDQSNNVKKVREAKMLSKAELARLAGISPLTLDRIEKGKDCRMATKRKVLLALGLSIDQKNTLFKQ
jgi:DNA-binding XRE family transcriptional regulator